jgi:4-hydroxybenzoate polyprenyltransferase
MLSTAYLSNRLYQYALLMRLHRPIGIYLLLWPTLWAVWLAGNGQPSVFITFIFIAGVVLMRSAGCVINDYADRDFDPHVQRTRDRPLATRRVSTKEALGLFIILCLLAFGLVLQLNDLTIRLSAIALLLAAMYPFTKRYTYLPQFFLGAAYSWSIPMAFAAQLNEIPNIAWWLFTANLFWTVAYDTMYAMVDKSDDLKIGVKSTAILFGNADKLIIALLQLAVFILLIMIGIQENLGHIYFLGLATATLFVFYQHWLIRHREPKHCFQAFLNNHWLGATIFIGIVADYLL